MSTRFFLGFGLFLSLTACKSVSSNSAFSPYDASGDSATFGNDADNEGSIDGASIAKGDAKGTLIAGHPKPWDFWVDPFSPAARVAKELRTQRSDDADSLEIIANNPVATWYNSSDAAIFDKLKSQMTEAKAQNQYALLVVDYLPYRNCPDPSYFTEYAAGNYQAWIKKFLASASSGKALVIFEPSGLSTIECLPEDKRKERLKLMNDALVEFKKYKNLMVYIDASNPLMQTDLLITYLQQAGIDKAIGFALNTGGYQTTKVSIERGKTIRKKFPDKNFVIDTSRNGLGPAVNDPKCNPRGRALGDDPTSETKVGGVDAFLWVKQPGESDGPCDRNDPPFGTFSPALAIELVKNAGL